MTSREYHKHHSNFGNKLTKDSKMIKSSKMKTLMSGTLMGGMLSLGAYFLVPTAQPTYACERSDIRRAISYCMDGATISEGVISTYC